MLVGNYEPLVRSINKLISMDICFIRYRKPVYAIIFGFVIGSVFELISRGASGGFSIIYILMFIIGYCLMRLILKKQADAYGLYS